LDIKQNEKVDEELFEISQRNGFGCILPLALASPLGDGRGEILAIKHFHSISSSL
jgi:hypothetical protein